MDKEEYSVPTPAARKVGIVLIIVGVCSLLLIQPFSNWYVNTVGNIHNIDYSRRILVISSFLPSIVFASLTSWLMTLGNRTITLKRWPPEGLPILYRTRKHKGRLAIINGVIFFLAGGFTWLIAIFWFFMTWKSYSL